MADNKRIAKNTVFLYFRMMLIMVVTLYTSRIILQTLGIEDYGIYNVVGGVVMMFTTVCGSLGGATSRFITFELGKKNFARLNTVFNTAFLAHCLIALIVVALCETIGLWFFYEKMTIPADRIDAAFWVLQLSILSTVFSLTQVPYTACIIAHEEMKIYAYIGIIEVLLRLGIVYLIMVSPIDKLIFYALLMFLSKVSVMMIYRYNCRKYQECTLKLVKDKQLFKEIFSYAGSDLIGSISVLAQGQGLNMLLNVFFGPVVNAARAIAYQVQSAITQFSNNFFTAARPQIIKLYAEGKVDEMMRLVYNSSWMSYYLLLAIVLPLCFERDYVLTLWLGKYPEHTGSFIILIMILCLIQSLKSPRVTIFHASGRILRPNIYVGLTLCAAFPIAYLFVSLGGNPESVFWAANISMALSEIVSVALLKYYVKGITWNYVMNVHGRCLIVSVLATVVLYYLQETMDSGLARVIAMSIASVFVVSVFAFYLGINKSLRMSVLDIIKLKFSKKK